MNSLQNPAIVAGMEARFASAARHSRMVRILRIAVPAAVVLAMAVIIFVSIYNPFRILLPKIPIDMSNLLSKCSVEACLNAQSTNQFRELRCKTVDPGKNQDGRSDSCNQATLRRRPAARSNDR